jgi:replication factor A1
MYMSGKQNNQRSLKVIDLMPNINHVNILVTVVSKTTRRKIISKNNRDIHWVADAHVGDETASIFLTLWDDQIQGIRTGDTIQIRNGYTSLFHNSLRLNIGLYGSYQVTTEHQISEVNVQNNRSLVEYTATLPFATSGVGWSYGRT